MEASTHLYNNGQHIRELNPRRDFFIVQEQPVTVPGVYSTPGVDIYTMLVGWEAGDGFSATLKVYVNSLINWVWIGGLELILGLVIVWQILRGWRKEPDQPATQATRLPAIDPDVLAKLEQELREMD